MSAYRTLHSCALIVNTMMGPRYVESVKTKCLQEV